MYRCIYLLWKQTIHTWDMLTHTSACDYNFFDPIYFYVLILYIIWGVQNLCEYQKVYVCAWTQCVCIDVCMHVCIYALYLRMYGCICMSLYVFSCACAGNVCIHVCMYVFECSMQCTSCFCHVCCVCPLFTMHYIWHSHSIVDAFLQHWRLAYVELFAYVGAALDVCLVKSLLYLSSLGKTNHACLPEKCPLMQEAKESSYKVQSSETERMGDENKVGMLTIHWLHMFRYFGLYLHISHIPHAGHVVNFIFLM